MKKHEVFPVENVATYFTVLRHLEIMTTYPIQMINVFPSKIAIKSSAKIDIKDIA